MLLVWLCYCPIAFVTPLPTQLVTLSFLHVIEAPQFSSREFLQDNGWTGHRGSGSTWHHWTSMPIDPATSSRRTSRSAFSYVHMTDGYGINVGRIRPLLPRADYCIRLYTAPGSCPHRETWDFLVWPGRRMAGHITHEYRVPRRHLRAFVRHILCPVYICVGLTRIIAPYG